MKLAEELRRLYFEHLSKVCNCDEEEECEEKRIKIIKDIKLLED